MILNENSSIAIDIPEEFRTNSVFAPQSWPIEFLSIKKLPVFFAAIFRLTIRKFTTCSLIFLIQRKRLLRGKEMKCLPIIACVLAIGVFSGAKGELENFSSGLLLFFRTFLNREGALPSRLS